MAKEMLSEELSARMEQDKRNRTYVDRSCPDEMAKRRYGNTTDTPVWRPRFAKDIDRIMYSPYYNRYTDKTQVFSLVKNDDITRRSLHVQLVSRIARTIGRALNLNLDLIEAIALGHDIGHTPFAHTGEVFLNQLYQSHTGRYFNHNIHSVRVLDKVFSLNLSLQTLVGIAGHNGEIELEEYRPVPMESFEQFDAELEKCYTIPGYANKIQPSTLEGNVVRISDIIAYLGKDRQDAARIQMIEQNAFPSSDIGTVNSEIINNLVVNIIENSYGKPYIKLDAKHFAAVKSVKRENYALIYENEPSRIKLEQMAKPMMTEIYEQLLEDLRLGKKNSPIFRHHIDYVNQSHYPRPVPYEQSEPNDIIVDYIASMTDDYLIDLYHFLFPNSPYHVEYTGYFTDLQCLE
ncbi:MAG: HD domain-containing protein [Ruminococcaceae bacterium]|nr:HD domain-containing protein [Oscillospiraceae bacterium]MBQ3214709.1 HD domain-containing protein [Oscillospiraceae bacterium]